VSGRGAASRRACHANPEILICVGLQMRSNCNSFSANKSEQRRNIILSYFVKRLRNVARVDDQICQMLIRQTCQTTTCQILLKRQTWANIFYICLHLANIWQPWINSGSFANSCRIDRRILTKVVSLERHGSACVLWISKVLHNKYPLAKINFDIAENENFRIATKVFHFSITMAGLLFYSPAKHLYAFLLIVGLCEGLATFKEMHRILFMTAKQFFECDSVRICALIRKSRISGSPQRFGKAGRSDFRELSTTERSWREMLLAWLLCRCSVQCVVHTQRQLCGFSSRALLLDRRGCR
jgi:hypothetical protein